MILLVVMSHYGCDWFSRLTSSYTSVLSLPNSHGSSSSLTYSIVLIILRSILRSTPSSGTGKVFFLVSICRLKKSVTLLLTRLTGALVDCWLATLSASMSGMTRTFSWACYQIAAPFFYTFCVVSIWRLFLLKPHPDLTYLLIDLNMSLLEM